MTDFLTIATGVIYFVLSATFLTSGLLLIQNLHQHFNKFYKQIKTPLWFATIFLSLTLFVRATLDIIRYVD
jgi:hypothetical protein